MTIFSDSSFLSVFLRLRPIMKLSTAPMEMVPINKNAHIVIGVRQQDKAREKTAIKDKPKKSFNEFLFLFNQR